MKKCIIIGIVIVIAASLVIWITNTSNNLGNISYSSSSSETSISDISFSGNAGDKIKFSFSSNIENGNLDIALYDSKGNAVKKLDKAKELATYFTFDYSDTYTLKAEYTDFIGRFKIDVYKAN